MVKSSGKTVKFLLPSNHSDDTRLSTCRPSKRHKSRHTPSRSVVRHISPFPSAVTRMSPRGLFYVIHCMTYEQWQDINAIGYGGLFLLNVDRLPMRLGYWLIDNYNPITNSLVLYGGKELPIRECDVHATLGLPMGPKRVQLATYIDESEEFSNFYHQWRSQFPRTSGLVSITTLQNYIATSQELGGDQFKVNFVVLVVSLMMKNNQKSYVNHHVLKSLMDVNDIVNYNWCEFILDSLRNAKLNWAAKKNNFEGPLLFLMLFYVDRVVHKKRDVDRDFFTLTGWTTEALCARQKEELKSFHFGEGTIVDIMVEDVNTQSLPQSSSVLANKQPDCPPTVKDYIHELALKTRSTAEHLVSLESLITDCPPMLSKNRDMKKLCNVAMKLMNEPYDEGNCSSPNEDVIDVSTITAAPENVDLDLAFSIRTESTSNISPDDDFYGSDDVLLAIQAAEKFFSNKGVSARPGTSQVIPLKSLSVSATHSSNPKEYIHDLAMNSARMVENMVILDNKYEIGATSFPNNETIKHLQSSTSVLYRTYGGCDEDDFPSSWVSGSKEEENIICFAKAAEDAYNKKRAAISRSQTFRTPMHGNGNSHGGVSPPSFSIGLSQDELLNNSKVELLPPNATVDPNTIVRRVLLDFPSTEEKDEIVGKKEGQQGEVVHKDDDIAYEIVHEKATEQSDSEKTISDADSEPDSDSVPSPTYQIVTRKRGSSAALVPELRSPYIVRDVDPASSLTKLQRLVCDYIYKDSDKDTPLNNEQVFKYKNIATVRRHFRSLKPHEHVSSAVIDCWSAYLNHREIAKSDASPLRFYASTLVLYMFINYRQDKSDESRYKSFSNGMNDELKRFPGVLLKSIDMFFFPVASDEHYYLIVFDLKTPAFHIIDNWLSRAQVENLYGVTPMLVAAAFGRFLKENEDTHSKGDVVLSLTPVIVKMPWKTTKNADDCGVFTMRHMETFMGDPKWKCGLKKNEVGTLSKLRDKYLSTLILFNGNELSQKIMIRAKEYHKQLQGLEKAGAQC